MGCFLTLLSYSPVRHISAWKSVRINITCFYPSKTSKLGKPRPCQESCSVYHILPLNPCFPCIDTSSLTIEPSTSIHPETTKIEDTIANPCYHILRLPGIIGCLKTRWRPPREAGYSSRHKSRVRNTSFTKLSTRCMLRHLSLEISCNTEKT